MWLAREYRSSGGICAITRRASMGVIECWWWCRGGPARPLTPEGPWVMAGPSPLPGSNPGRPFSCPFVAPFMPHSAHSGPAKPADAPLIDGFSRLRCNTLVSKSVNGLLSVAIGLYPGVFAGAVATVLPGTHLVYPSTTAARRALSRALPSRSEALSCP